MELRQRKINSVYKNKVLDKMKYRGRVGPWVIINNDLGDFPPVNSPVISPR